MNASFRTPELLLRQTTWITALARRMVDDPALADDLVQETLLRALERPARLPSSPRAWLAGILRNVMRQDRRTRGRARERELEASREERLPPTSEAIELLEMQRDVVSAVLALDEPYRSTVVERFFEDRPPREIAARHGVPVATVKSRLARGVAQLKRRLDDRYGDRRAWGLAWIPLLPLPTTRLGWASVAARTLLMTTTSKYVLGTLSAVGLFAAWHLARAPREDARSSAPAAVEARVAEAPTAPTDTPAVAPAVDPTTRVALPVDAPTSRADEPAETAASVPSIRGHVLDPDGRGIGGLRVVLRSGDDAEPMTIATSGASGAFSANAPHASGTLGVASDTFATLLAAKYEPTRTVDDLIVVAARSESYAGRVFDQDGATLEGVRLTIVQPQMYRDPLEPRLHRTAAIEHTTTSAEDGSFDLGRVPFQAGLTLRAQNEGSRERTFALPAQTDRSLEIVLAEASDEETFLAGVVLDPDGDPVSGALVGGGRGCVRTDSAGMFELPRADADAALRAAAEGFLPVEYEPDGDDAWPDFIELWLEDTPQSIAGRVVDVQGEPIVGYLVWIDDATYFGTRDDAVLAAESIALGSFDDGVRDITDADGRFELGGLGRRAYKLRAMNRETALIVDTPRIEAGSHDVVIEVSDDLYRPPVFGRVVGVNGTPVPGVGVRVEAPAYTSPGSEVGMMAVGLGTTTAEDGSFVLARVPRNANLIFVSSDDVMRTSHNLDERGANIEIRVRRRAHVHVVARPDLPPDTTMSILDEDGNAVGLTRRIGTMYMQARSHALIDGAFDIVSCVETARTLVLSSAGQELLRRRVSLVPGEVTRIEL